jgi:hypothetical protein
VDALILFAPCCVAYPIARHLSHEMTCVRLM